MVADGPDSDLCSATYRAIVSRYDDDTPIWAFRPTERIVVLAWQTAGILENGGFEYLLGNDLPGDPDYSLTLEAFETIGSTVAADAVRAARSLFVDGSPPPSLDIRRQQFEAIDHALVEVLDAQFWSDNTIAERLGSFIRQHKGELPEPEDAE